jgi:hypothetical protein
MPATLPSLTELAKVHAWRGVRELAARMEEEVLQFAVRESAKIPHKNPCSNSFFFFMPFFLPSFLPS